MIEKLPMVGESLIIKELLIVQDNFLCPNS